MHYQGLYALNALFKWNIVYSGQRSCGIHIGRVITKELQLQLQDSSRNEPEIPQNPLKDIYSASYQPENGKIYDKKPFKMSLEKGKNYFWCLCGESKNQPFCDGTHRSSYLKIKHRPIKFQVTKDKEYWLCNCKQTSNRPFCDGTHKRDDIQAAIK